MAEENVAKAPNIEDEVAKILLSQLISFQASGKSFNVSPLTLGKKFLLRREVEALEINMEIVTVNPYIEAMRLSRVRRMETCRFLAYHTMNDVEELFDSAKVAQRAIDLGASLTDDELAQILSLAITYESLDVIMESPPMKQDTAKRKRIAEAKAGSDKNSVTVGGHTVWGTVIDPLCEKYGWTLDYVLWHISLANIQMLLADAISTIHLTDEELKHAHIPRGTIISADNPANMNALKELIKQR